MDSARRPFYGRQKLRIDRLLWEILSSASRALVFAYASPSAEALGYFHTVRYRGRKTRQLTF
jgi:hypothetical protein